MISSCNRRKAYGPSQQNKVAQLSMLPANAQLCVRNRICFGIINSCKIQPLGLFHCLFLSFEYFGSFHNQAHGFALLTERGCRYAAARPTSASLLKNLAYKRWMFTTIFGLVLHSMKYLFTIVPLFLRFIPGALLQSTLSEQQSATRPYTAFLCKKVGRIEQNYYKEPPLHRDLSTNTAIAFQFAQSVLPRPVHLSIPGISMLIADAGT